MSNPNDWQNEREEILAISLIRQSGGKEWHCRIATNKGNRWYFQGAFGYVIAKAEELAGILK